MSWGQERTGVGVWTGRQHCKPRSAGMEWEFAPHVSKGDPWQEGDLEEYLLEGLLGFFPLFIKIHLLSLNLTLCQVLYKQTWSLPLRNF